MDLLGLPAAGRAVVRRLTQRSSSNFKFAFLFLGPEQRAALESVYGYCRIVDDIVDERPPGPDGEAQASAGLERWRREIEAIYDPRATPEDPLAQRLREHLSEFAFPKDAFTEIIEGCAMDLERSRYGTLEELELYCYRVASCVGRLCIVIFGDASEGAERYARHLGLALQYTNILRDVGEDALRGRVYLPADLLARHGLNDSDILASRYDRRFLTMAREFAAIAESEYTQARAAFKDCANRPALVAAEVMGRTYHQILVELRANGFNVFARRPGLKRRDKLKAALGALIETRRPAATMANPLQ